ncbi:hypothetical protein PV416_46735, partial [Streptomyces ipomoeae]|uniref:hypothetical protein n=1 Tax=Streptomyces ipomoeae TaxID=103232 RepID=UPI0029A3B90B
MSVEPSDAPVSVPDPVSVPVLVSVPVSVPVPVPVPELSSVAGGVVASVDGVSAAVSSVVVPSEVVEEPVRDCWVEGIDLVVREEVPPFPWESVPCAADRSVVSYKHLRA